MDKDDIRRIRNITLLTTGMVILSVVLYVGMQLALVWLTNGAYTPVWEFSYM